LDPESRSAKTLRDDVHRLETCHLYTCTIHITHCVMCKEYRAVRPVRITMNGNHADGTHCIDIGACLSKVDNVLACVYSLYFSHSTREALLTGSDAHSASSPTPSTWILRSRSRRSRSSEELTNGQTVNNETNATHNSKQDVHRVQKRLYPFLIFFF